MAKRPRLLRDQEGDWKIAGSFSSGRYQFTLGTAAERLLRNDLDYGEDEPVPLELFRTLVFAGDAWLPGSPERPVEAGEDLIEPRSLQMMTEAEARTLADHLRGRRVGDRQRSALREQLDRTPLGRHLTVAALRRTDEWVEELPAQVEGDDDGSTTEASGSGSTEPADEADLVPAAGEESGETGSAPATGEEPTEEPADPTDEPAGQTDVESASLAYLADLEAAADPDFEALSTRRLADAYALLSKIERRAGDLRTAARDALADRLGEDQDVSGEFGTVRGTRRTRRSRRDDETVLAAVERHGFARETVLTEEIDADELDELLEVPGVDESEFYEVSESSSVRRIDVDVDAVVRRAARESSGEVACPVEGCSYRGEPASVAAHVSGVHDDDHDWSKLPYDGPSDFRAGE